MTTVFTPGSERSVAASCAARAGLSDALNESFFVGPQWTFTVAFVAASFTESTRELRGIAVSKPDFCSRAVGPAKSAFSATTSGFRPARTGRIAVANCSPWRK
jgi:hypothetical protein